MKYIWQSNEWPDYKWDLAHLSPALSDCRKAQGFLQGQLAILGLGDKAASRGNVLVEEALQTSAIEGVKLDIEALRSSVARQLGIDLGAKNVHDKRADGIVKMLLDATAKYEAELTEERLWGWQASLFPTGYSDISKIEVGKWRSGKVYVVSGPMGKEKIHYEAPPAEKVREEMKGFLGWWKNSQVEIEGLIRAGVAHLYFVQIHPFADGNGRVARALADMALAQDENSGQRYYSLSEAIFKNRPAYYDMLERTGRNGLDITNWLIWFLKTLKEAIVDGEKRLAKVLMKIKFWRRHENMDLNARQRKVLNRMLDEEPGGFKGGLTTRKYLSITKTSRATAGREISDLLSKKLIKSAGGGGRSTTYELILQ